MGLPLPMEVSLENDSKYTISNSVSNFGQLSFVHFNPWASNLFIAKGHAGYCGLVSGSHVEK
jgi:hypothetical protein